MQDVTVKSGIEASREGRMQAYVSVLSTFAGRDYEFCMEGLSEIQAKLVCDVATQLLQDLIDRNMIAKPLEWKKTGGQ